MGSEWWVIAAVLVLLYLLVIKKRTHDAAGSSIPKPWYDERIHEFSDHAVREGADMYDRIVHLNAEHPDQELVQEYAALNDEYARCLTMYFDAPRRSRDPATQRRALYWAAWSQEMQAREESMRAEHDLTPYVSPEDQG